MKTGQNRNSFRPQRITLTLEEKINHNLGKLVDALNRIRTVLLVEREGRTASSGGPPLPPLRDKASIIQEAIDLLLERYGVPKDQTVHNVRDIKAFRDFFKQRRQGEK